MSKEALSTAYSAAAAFFFLYCAFPEVGHVLLLMSVASYDDAFYWIRYGIVAELVVTLIVARLITNEWLCLAVCLFGNILARAFLKEKNTAVSFPRGWDILTLMLTVKFALFVLGEWSTFLGFIFLTMTFTLLLTCLFFSHPAGFYLSMMPAERDRSYKLIRILVLGTFATSIAFYGALYWLSVDTDCYKVGATLLSTASILIRGFWVEPPAPFYLF